MWSLKRDFCNVINEVLRSGLTIEVGTSRQVLQCTVCGKM